MNRARRMQPAVRMARAREDDAARELGQYRHRLAAQERRLQELQQYQAEYGRELRRAETSGIEVTRAVEFRQFLARLDQALGEQQRVIEQLRVEVQRRLAGWQGAHARTQGLLKVVQRIEAEERQQAERREQALMDEHALRVHRQAR